MVNVEFFGNFPCSCLRESASVMALNKALSTSDGQPLHSSSSRLPSPLQSFLKDHSFFTTLWHPFVIQVIVYLCSHVFCPCVDTLLFILPLRVWFEMVMWEYPELIFSHGRTDPTAIYRTTSSEKKQNKTKQKLKLSELPLHIRQMRGNSPH